MVAQAFGYTLGWNITTDRFLSVAMLPPMTESSHPSGQARPSRKDRLIQLIAILRNGALHRAEDLATATGVTPRTLYRDMETLIKNGVPVKGERGVGYQMTQAVTLPPLNMSMQELEVLHLGVAVMTEASDPDLRKAARKLAQTLDEALPENGVGASTSWGLSVHPFADTSSGVVHMPAVRTALRQHKKLSIRYQQADGTELNTVIRPISLDYWGRIWTCQAWCETSQSSKEFRIDKILQLTEISSDFMIEAID